MFPPARVYPLLPAFVIVLCALPVSAQTMITGAQIRNPLTPVSALPSSCQPYSLVFLTTTNTSYICTAANTFTPLSGAPQSSLPSSAGIAGYLMTNGTTVSWGNLLTGGSGGLDCSSVPGQCDLVPAVVPFKASANAWTGLNDFSGALVRLPEATVSGLPTPSSNAGREFVVTDGASICDTTVGGGTYSVLVRSTGSSYVAPNCGGGSSLTGVIVYTSGTWTPIVAGWTTYSPNTIDHDSSGGTMWTSGNPAYITAPSAGTYRAECIVTGGSGGGYAAIQFQINGATNYIATNNSYGAIGALEGTRTIHLNAGDRVACQYYMDNASSTSGGANGSHFSLSKEAW